MKLICYIGQALHEYGTSAHRLQSILENIATTFGIKGNFFSTPTYLAISVDSRNIDGEYEQIHQHLRVSPGEANLFKMQLIDQVANKVTNHEMGIDEAISEIKMIRGMISKFPKYLTLIAFSLTSLSLAILFKGGVTEILLCLFAGSIVGLLNQHFC